MQTKIATLKTEVLDNLQQNILPYWMKLIDLKHGGFIGRIKGDESIERQASKGAVLNARLLWSFSAAYRTLKDPVCLAFATRAKKYLLTHFYDAEHGGIFWSVDYMGRPESTKKQIYALGFAIYALSEYARATGDQDALGKAIELFETIEKHSYDHINGGYYEAFARDWSELPDMRLSDKDANERKTMNTHLHILEPYTNLYRVWPDRKLKTAIENLIDVFSNRITDRQTHHLNLFFGDEWDNRSSIISYGHDIEASWLIHEAASVINEKQLIEETEKLALKIADAASEGLQPEGSMIYEYDLTTKHTDSDRHWWVQAETVIGFFNAYEISGEQKYLDRALINWQYIKNHLVDNKNGEWYWSINKDGKVNPNEDKAGFWKCPYHNTRMCLEILERAK